MRVQFSADGLRNEVSPYSGSILYRDYAASLDVIKEEGAGIDISTDPASKREQQR